MKNLKGRTLSQARDEATIQVDNVLICTMAIWAPDLHPETAIWLAALLNQNTPDYYLFYDMPSMGQVGSANVVMYDERQAPGMGVMGFCYPAHRQPLLKKYLIEETVHDTAEPKADDRRRKT